MILYTIGFAQKTAERFFSLLTENQIELLIDIRLNNKSQLAGFTKGNDLEFFLKRICNCAYKYCAKYAPTKEILNAYQKKEINWDEYEKRYTELITKRGDYVIFHTDVLPFKRVALLCSEPTADQCHRRLLSELLQKSSEEIRIHHL
jgi:uncharacterized protein (DUF488 family)